MCVVRCALCVVRCALCVVRCALCVNFVKSIDHCQAPLCNIYQKIKYGGNTWPNLILAPEKLIYNNEMAANSQARKFAIW